MTPVINAVLFVGFAKVAPVQLPSRRRHPYEGARRLSAAIFPSFPLILSVAAAVLLGSRRLTANLNSLCALRVSTKQSIYSSGTQRRRSRRRASRSKRIVAALASARGRLIAFFGFVLLVALLGGSSRPDVPGLIVLRPLAVLFCVYAFLVASREQLRSVLAPLLLVGSLMALALLQLVPLPPSVWSSLPGRELVAEATILAGLDDVWRPLSLDPNRTWNALFALFVPLAAVCLVGAQERRAQAPVLWTLLGVALVSAALGFLQAIGGSALHFYDVSHRGYPIGLFANKNHQAILLLWLMLAASYLAGTTVLRRHSANMAVGSALAAIAVLFPLLILTGSRAGLLLSLPTLAGCAWILLDSPVTSAFLRRGGRQAKLLFAGGLAVVIGVVAVIFAVLALSDRRTALSRLFDLSAGEDLRSLYFPRFLDMIRDYFPVGSGLGSFENAFNIYEPVEHLTTRYMNLAHNDPIQLLIEGGLLAAAIIAAGLFWLARAGWRLWRSPRQTSSTMAIFYCGSIALWLAAGIVDYPLRTPLGATLFVCLTAQLSILSTRRG